MIQIAIIRRVIGAMLLVFSVSLLPPIVVSLIYSDGKWGAFLALTIFTFFAGVLFFRNTPENIEPRTRDGILIVVMIWVIYSLVGALPFYWILNVSFADAVFESISGLTTTGSTVLLGLDSMAKSILWYRQQLGLMGGMGVLILAVAILPMFNIGGMRLYKAEATGPVKDDKMAPRIAQNARMLFSVYLSLVVAVAAGFWIAGMTMFDALTHSFATVATGGFGNYDAGFGYFNSPMLEAIAIIGMLAGALNFGLLYMIWLGKDLSVFVSEQESKTFLGVLAFSILLVSLMLYVNSSYPDFITSFRYATFQIVSVVTTTGFGTADMSSWPSFTAPFIFLLAFIGGCSGSTSGGIKMIRFFLLFKQVSREAKKLVQPGIVSHVKYNGRIVSANVTDGVWAFFALFVSTALLFVFLLMATGIDFATAFAVVSSSINNMGFGTNNPQLSFAAMNDMAKWICSACMLAGRLEVMTFFVLFTPIFWRRF